MSLSNAAFDLPQPVSLKLEIDQPRFEQCLQHVQSVVEKKNTIPILANILIEAIDGAIKITATDMDLVIEERIECDVDVPGSITAPAHMLYDIARKLPPQEKISIEVNEKGEQLTIVAGKAEFTLPCLPTEDFPLLKEEELPARLTLSTEELEFIIDRVKSAISTEETRYYLNGIFFHVLDTDDKKVLRAVATDGHRLARVELPWTQTTEMPDFILPRKTVHEVKKLIAAGGKDITIELSANRIRFRFENIILTSKLIDGRYPDYERVIPKENHLHLTLSCAALNIAVDRVATVTTDKARSVKFSLTNNHLDIMANSPVSGLGHEELTVNYTGTPLQVGFSVRYLLDITQQLKGSEVHFIFKDPDTPIVLFDDSEPQALYVLMPMRVA